MTCAPAAQKELSDCRRTQLTTPQGVCQGLSEQPFQRIPVDQRYGQREGYVSCNLPVSSRLELGD